MRIRQKPLSQETTSRSKVTLRLTACALGFALLATACSDEAGSQRPAPTASPVISEATPTPGTADTAPEWAKENYGLMPVAEVAEPMAATSREGSTKLWVAERAGVVRIVDLGDLEEVTDPSSPITIQLADDEVLDISDRVGVESEGGLLGIAFSPDGEKLYTSYTNLDGDSVLSEFDMDGDKARTNERVLFEASQPFGNHNGGHIDFGPDEMLYLGLGDGGSGGDPEENGQDLSTHLGSILRIDPTPDGDQAYTLPDDNPFTEANTDNPDAQPEIWAYGLRNPWKFSFDSLTGDLWIGDVGQNRFEEIDFLPAGTEGAGRGANLGWNFFEGDQSFEGAAEPANHEGPLFTYETSEDQCSVIGGRVYRGSVIEPLQGVYVFADFCSDSLVGLEQSGGEVVARSPLTLDRSVEKVVGLGRGPAGETYVLEQGGQISRLVLPDGGGGGSIA